MLEMIATHFLSVCKSKQGRTIRKCSGMHPVCWGEVRSRDMSNYQLFLLTINTTNTNCVCGKSINCSGSADAFALVFCVERDLLLAHGFVAAQLLVIVEEV